MEFQKKARRDQLCILIYLLLIFIFWPINLANSSTTKINISATSLSADPQSILYSSHYSPQPQRQSPSFSLILLDSSHKHQYNNLSFENATAFMPASADTNSTLAAGSVTNTVNNATSSSQPITLSSSSAPLSSSTSAENTSTISKPLSPQSQKLYSVSSSSSGPTTQQPTTFLTSTSTIPQQPLKLNNSTRPSIKPWRDKQKRICQGVHIRNDLKSFEQLRGCDIIDGPLTIALVSNQSKPYEPKDFENITFPLLTEITDYLLFFRVQGLTHLSTLFPNLAVIRGRELVSNYALIIYEMMHLQKVNLPSLNDILRGSVRIESNPNLCYVSTVNWEAICKHKFVPHFIRDNNLRCNSNRCPEQCRPWSSTNTLPQSFKSPPVTGISNNNDPTNKLDIAEFGADNNRSIFCWSNQNCQEACQDHDGLILTFAPDGDCCSPLCAGGCYESNRSNACISCRYVMQGDRCVEHCDSNLFEFKGKCISEEVCESTTEVVEQSSCERYESMPMKYFKAIRLPSDKYGGRCQAHCPPDSEEDPNNPHKCKTCDKGKCRKSKSTSPGPM